MAGPSVKIKPRESKRYLAQCARVLTKAEDEYNKRWQDYYYDRVEHKVDDKFWRYVCLFGEIAHRAGDRGYTYFEYCADEFMRQIDVGQIDGETWDYVVFARTYYHVKWQYYAKMDDWGGFGMSDDSYEYFCDGLPLGGPELYRKVIIDEVIINPKQLKKAIKELGKPWTKLMDNGEGYEFALFESARDRYRNSLRRS